MFYTNYKISEPFTGKGSPAYSPKRKKERYRLLIILFLPGCLLFNLQLFAQTVNSVLPENMLKPGEPMTVTFSKEPKDREFFHGHFFEEPLVPMEGAVSSEENSDLMLALARFSQRKSPDDFTSITRFLIQYPTSRWRGALLANLGLVYRRTGYYNKSLEAWLQAWTVMKNESNHKVKVLADRVVAELLMLYCWIGRPSEISLLLKQIDNRVIEGGAHERVEACRAALWLMENRTGVSFKCGPYALNRLFILKDSTKPYSEKMMAAQSPTKGFSLSQLKQMAKDIGLNYQMAFRTPGAPVIEKAVVHWKLDHYSALIKMESGHYRCEDATASTVYGQKFWLTPAALDSSASGYFLVSEGSLPAGWRRVEDAEGSTIFGKGEVPPDNGKHCSDCDIQTGKCACSGMAYSSVHLAAVSLHIEDRPFFYSTPKGPAVSWEVDYHQRDSYQPANFTYPHMGKQWTFNWLSYVQDNPDNPSADADVYLIGGGVRTFTGYNTDDSIYLPELQSNDVLKRISTCCYELRHPDGSKEVYSRPDGSNINGRKIFLTKRVDVAGNAVTLNYDGFLRIISLKDALNRKTTISYENNEDIYQITKVAALGRSAIFEYDGSDRLQKITDMIGMSSSFQYDAGNFITQMTTPYGITRFTKQDGPENFRSLQIDHPLGAKERVEFKDTAAGIPFSEIVAPAGMNLFNSNLYYRNTFYWDKKAMLEASGDYTKAKIYHWLHGSSGTNENGFVAPILESIKEPLENRVWYNYQGQSSPGFANQGMSSSPSIIGRVLSDGTTQLIKAGYNSLGADTFSLDPNGRRTSYKYAANQIDLLEVRQTTGGVNELLAKYTYNTKHLPLTATDASGKITEFTYNAAGQVETITNPKKEKTTFSYDTKGFLNGITGPMGASVNFTYDNQGRVKTVTDAENYTVTTNYDKLDRPTKITYPDGTFEQITYDRLDAVAMRDRMGRLTRALYDSLDRLNAITDPLGRITQFIWCNCGNLAEIVDPLKQITTFTYDLQSRLTSKIFHDGKTITYKYDSTTSRLNQVRDAKGQQTNYSYFIDDNLKQITYTNTLVATPTVVFAYDSKYNRLTDMLDGTGTTSYSYYPISANPVLGAGRLKKVDGPLNNDNIVYTYDVLGRVSSRSINGVAASVVYDSLGRIKSDSNVLGKFAYSYINATTRLAGIIAPNSTSTVFSYFDNPGDQRLKEIWNKKGTATISKFGYEYNTEGQIIKWTQQAGSAVPKYYELNYDLADQLIAATQKNQNTDAVLKRYAYTYDKAGNRISKQTNNVLGTGIYNSLNQMTGQTDGGQMFFKGKVNEFASVQIKNQTSADSVNALVDTLNVFRGFVKMIPGTTNNILITATDYSGNNNTNIDTFNITTGHDNYDSLHYDDNGNTTYEAEDAVSYYWDAADRLVKIKQGATTREFIYDGLSRRVAEKLNNKIIKRWLWCGTELCEERSVNGSTVTKRFFPQGEQIGTAKYYFTRDHLGSIRELTDMNGNLVTRYEYTPYGRRVLVSGTVNADFGFTGHYYDTASALCLALYRAYDANLGRWLSRDPIGEKGGLNLYGYVQNKPIIDYDMLGLRSGITGPFMPPKVPFLEKIGGPIGVTITITNAAVRLRKCMKEAEEKHLECLKNAKCPQQIKNCDLLFALDASKCIQGYVLDIAAVRDAYEFGKNLGEAIFGEY
ncbi:MAG TPA: RHS repeat-associated core domain-containing protein [Parafilimonas sp.]|nr:RHS repeat-associated core domain-containing protein [Parafilimonas sp.]